MGLTQIMFILFFQFVTADVTPTGVLLATLNVSGEIFFVKINCGAVYGESVFSVLVHTQGEP